MTGFHTTTSFLKSDNRKLESHMDGFGVRRLQTSNDETVLLDRG